MSLPHGYMRSSPAPAASDHSASVGRRLPSQLQNMNASNQVTQSMGFSSLGPGASVQVTTCEHASFDRSSNWLEGSSSFQMACQPLFAMCGLAPCPWAGRYVSYAAKNFRNRPTVTWYRSSWNSLTFAAKVLL